MALNQSLSERYLIYSKNAYQRQFWEEYLEHEWLDTCIPADGEGQVAGDGYTLHSLELKTSLASSISRLSGESSFNTYLVLLSGMAVLLRKYVNENKLQIGTPVFSTEKNAVFINEIVPLRIWAPGELSMKQILVNLKKSVTDIIKHQNYPIDILRHMLEGGSVAGEPATGVDVVFVLENLQNIEFAGRAHPSLIFAFEQTGGGFRWNIHYRSDRYSAAKISRLAAHYQSLLETCLQHMNVPVGSIGWGEEGREDMWHRPAREYRGRYASIIEVFHEQVKIYPHRTALLWDGNNVTYRQLDERAGQLAELLTERLGGNPSVVGIMLERSVEMIVAILGILKAGCAYLPLDPSHPADRVNYILNDSGCAVIVSNDRHITGLPAGLTLINLDRPGITETKRQPAPTTLEDPLYIIYTSGTTGRPKGAIIENKNLLSLFFSDDFPFAFGPEDTWLLFHSYCFDFSVWEIFGALLFGGQLVIMPELDAKDPDILAQVLKEQKITVLNQTPSAFYNLILSIGRTWPELPSLRYVIFGGEALTPCKLAKWAYHYPGVRLINMYGITETTIHVTYKEITVKEIDADHSNIGMALPHLSAVIINQDGDMLPPGLIGEICVGGEGVSRGYLNKPELTMKRFCRRDGNRAYLSGDLGYLTEDGEIIYIGRRDAQVQLKGYRIELGEIESALLKFPGIEHAIVLLKEEDAENRYLCAWYVARERLDSHDILRSLKDMLPVYMIPSFLVCLDKLPLNHNGKIDIGQLPGPDREVKKTPAAYGEREVAMARIWENSLRMEQVSADESFFNIGGDSMKAIRLLHQVNEHFNVRLSLKDIYKYDTIDKLLSKIAEVAGKEDEEVSGIIEERMEALKKEVMAFDGEPESIEDAYPLSDMQKGMVYHSSLDTKYPRYHDLMLHRMQYKDFDHALFGEAIRWMTDRHTLLRASFNMTDYSEPMIIIRRSVVVGYTLTDLSNRQPAQQDDEIASYIEQEKSRRFDLKTGPLWRINVFLLDKDHIVFLLVCHHAIMDGWSDAVFKTELHNRYISLKQGKDDGRQLPRCTYRDFVLSERLQNKRPSTAAFWKEELSGYKKWNIPGIGNTDPEKTPASFRLTFPEGALSQLDTFCTQYAISRKTALFGAYIITVHSLNYMPELVVGYTTHNRPARQDGDRIIGCFLNVLPFRVAFLKDESWLHLMKRLEEKCRRLNEYNHSSLLGIVEVMGEGGQSANPFFDTLFNFTDFYVYNELDTSEDVSQAIGASGGYTNTNTLLDFNVSNTRDNFELIVNYSQGHISADTVQKLAACYSAVLEKLPLAGSYFVRDRQPKPILLDLGMKFRRLEREPLAPAPKTICFDPGNQLLAELRRFSTDADVSLPGLLLTLYAVLLYKYTLQEELLVGLTITGRNGKAQREVDALLPQLPVRMRIRSDKDIFFHYGKYRDEGYSAYEAPDITSHQLIDTLLEKNIPADACLVETSCLVHNGLTEDDSPTIFVSFRDWLPGEIVEGMKTHFKEIISQVIADRRLAIDDIILSGKQVKTVFAGEDIMEGFNF